VRVCVCVGWLVARGGFVVFVKKFSSRE